MFPACWPRVHSAIPRRSERWSFSSTRQALLHAFCVCCPSRRDTEAGGAFSCPAHARGSFASVNTRAVILIRACAPFRSRVRYFCPAFPLAPVHLVSMSLDLALARRSRRMVCPVLCLCKSPTCCRLVRACRGCMPRDSVPNVAELCAPALPLPMHPYRRHSRAPWYTSRSPTGLRNWSITRASTESLLIRTTLIGFSARELSLAAVFASFWVALTFLLGRTPSFCHTYPDAHYGQEKGVDRHPEGVRPASPTRSRHRKHGGQRCGDCEYGAGVQLAGAHPINCTDGDTVKTLQQMMKAGSAAAGESNHVLYLWLVALN